MSHVFLALAALALVAAIVFQDLRYVPFRSETVSQGLNGPGHLWLDGAYVLLAAALVWAFRGAALPFAILTAVALVASGICNTAWRWVDGLTGKPRGHEAWHLHFTYIVFCGAFAVEAFSNHGSLWWLSLAGLLAPLEIWALTKRTDLAEKSAVMLMCLWMVAWAL